MKTVFRIVVIAAGVASAGCASIGVQPWQRDVLARQDMQLTTDPVEAAIDDHAG